MTFSPSFCLTQGARVQSQISGLSDPHIPQHIMPHSWDESAISAYSSGRHRGNLNGPRLDRLASLGDHFFNLYFHGLECLDNLCNLLRRTQSRG